MTKLFLQIINISISAGYLILAVLVIRLLFRKMPGTVRCVLWMLTGLRLLLPALPQTSFSLLPSNQVFGESKVYENLPVIDSGYEALDQRINQIVQAQYTEKHPESISPYQIMTLWGSVIWLSGVGILLLYFLYCLWRTRQQIRLAVPQDRVEGKIYRCEGIESPFLFGIFEPKIYLPWEMPEGTEKSVLLHEKIHLKRKDHMIKPLFYLLFTLHWFNPLVWAAYLCLCRDMEFACDEQVLKQIGETGKKEYSQALLDCSVKRNRVHVCPVAFGESSTAARIKRILYYKKPAGWLLAAAIGICILVTLLFMTGKREQAGEKTLVYGDYEITLEQAKACRDTRMFYARISVSSKKASRAELEDFGAKLLLGQGSYLMEGGLQGDIYVKEFRGNYQESIEKMMTISSGIGAQDAEGEAAFSTDYVEWEESKTLQVQLDLRECRVIVSPSSMAVALENAEAMEERERKYTLFLINDEGKRWKAAEFPVFENALSQTEENLYDREISSSFLVEDREKAGYTIWRFAFTEEIPPEVIPGLRLEIQAEEGT